MPEHPPVLEEWVFEKLMNRTRDAWWLAPLVAGWIITLPEDCPKFWDEDDE